MRERIEQIMKMIEDLTQNSQNPLKSDDYEIHDLGCPHKWPTQLPSGYCAVYFYAYKDQVLKIGKANLNSKARYTSQHYRINSTKSTLAKSIYEDKDFASLDKTEIKSWMLNNLQRIDILIKVKDYNDRASTELIEAVLHYFFRPKYEGALH